MGRKYRLPTTSAMCGYMARFGYVDVVVVAVGGGGGSVAQAAARGRRVERAVWRGAVQRAAVWMWVGVVAGGMGVGGGGHGGGGCARVVVVEKPDGG